MREIKNRQHERWQTFDQFKERAFCIIWVVAQPVDKKKWIEGRCNRIEYFSHFATEIF